MNSLAEYLNLSKTEFLKNLDSFSDVHIVLGNESCDLDSTISPLTLAYFLSKHRISEISASALIIPVINVSQEQFLIRRENCFVLEDKEISLEWLIYRDEVNFEELLKIKRVTTSLVDHHVLSINDQILQPTVIQIFDHRPLDNSSNWESTNCKLRIEEVGSCSTLIADEIIRTSETLLDNILAYIIYETIIYDTIGLLPENGRAKQLDIEVAKKLEEKFNFKESRKVVFDRLYAVHNDVSCLNPNQILLKDLKFVEKIPVPGLPMLVENFLKLKDAHQAIEHMTNKYDVSLLVLIGIDASNATVKRDVGIYWRKNGEELKNEVLEKFSNSDKLKGYNFNFEKIDTDFHDVICLRQNNIKLSRKQIIPLIKEVVTENKTL